MHLSRCAHAFAKRRGSFRLGARRSRRDAAARDAVDLRITRSVRDGSGKIIEKETDLPADQRWPDYRSLPALVDADGDGLPDFWEKQFALNPNDANDSAKLSGGCANIEHYCNNTDPRGEGTPIVFIAASVSRALVPQTGEWRVTRTGSTAEPLRVNYAVSGDATSGGISPRCPEA